MTQEAHVEGIAVAVGDTGDPAPAVLLEVNDEYVPIFVSPGQAQSISVALESAQPPRPLTHDLLIEMVTEAGGAFDQVRIDALRDGTYFAKIDGEFYHGGEVQEHVFDCRPSDGIALALRIDCPIEVAQAVVEAAGMSPDEVHGPGEASGRGTERFRIDDDDELR